MQIQLANPRGFCAGVDRAIAIVDRALEIFGAPIYVRHEVVHNRFVVNSLRDRGAVFIDEVSQAPDEATLIFSAHGVSQQVRQEAEQRQLRVFDATCPLVTKVHLEVARYGKMGMDVVLIGHRGHPEVEGTMGQYLDPTGQGSIYLVEKPTDVAEIKPHKNRGVAYVTQTTLSMDDTKVIIAALKERFPDILGPKQNDICYATQNRQDAIKELAQCCDLVLVVGSPNSSNSNRLREIAEYQGTPAYLVDGPEDLQKDWFSAQSCIGITAGASAPEVLVQDIIHQLEDWGATAPTELGGVAENVRFVLPEALRPA
jgi:4-hydroxy-3-methylbut-2-enyl diphosphate reductase